MLHFFTYLISPQVSISRMAVKKSSNSVSVVTATQDQSVGDNLLKNIPKTNRTRKATSKNQRASFRRARVRRLSSPNITSATEFVEQSVAARTASVKKSSKSIKRVEQAHEKREKSVLEDTQPNAKSPTASNQKTPRKRTQEDSVRPSPPATGKKETKIPKSARKSRAQTHASANKTSTVSEKAGGIQKKTTRTSKASTSTTRVDSKKIRTETKSKSRKTSKEIKATSPSVADRERKRTNQRVTKKKSLSNQRSAKVASSSKKTGKASALKDQAVPPKRTAVRRPKVNYEFDNEYVIGFQGIYYKPYKLTAKDLFMSVAQQDHFLDILTRAKEKLITEEADRANQIQENDTSNLPDPLDQGANEGVFHNQLRTRDRESQLVRKINRAIDCIRTGSYGYCEACGCEIPIRRLEARPIVTKCIDCKERDELRERQLGH